eukprot:6195910-Ditylum_brightwellii.AAC.1
MVKSKRDLHSITGENSYGGWRVHYKRSKYQSPCQIVTSKLHGRTANMPDIAERNAVIQAPASTISDTNNCVPLPKYLQTENRTKTAEKRGHCLVDIKALKSVVNNKFCCTKCNGRAVWKEIKEFLLYADDFYAKKKKEVNKIENLAHKVREH